MMKRPMIFAAAIAAAIVCLSSTPNASGADALRKFGRGISNLTWGWTDLPMSIHHQDVMWGPAAAYTYGVVKGTWQVICRTAVGIWEVATFPLPWPDGYWPVYYGPEFPLHEFNQNLLWYE